MVYVVYMIFVRYVHWISISAVQHSLCSSALLKDNSLTHPFRFENIRWWWIPCWCLATVPMLDFGKCAIRPSSMWNPLILRLYQTIICGHVHVEPLSCDFLFSQEKNTWKQNTDVRAHLQKIQSDSIQIWFAWHDRWANMSAAHCDWRDRWRGEEGRRGCCLTFIEKRCDDVTLSNGRLVNVRYKIFTFIRIGTSGMTTTIRIFIRFIIQIFVHIQ